eukprot:CAMPEP_0181521124 /NCGR_PEP_ID=MMETSP1110-20121109/66675_1 /TAXON_ID=174948 /ORGANISM="Symbiodinium sp., Strain CCMP421" /LENGTH=126 /DNA_ID=CAMNT_0023651657 /DNA_START=214 /DNA_END=595 /DNA_ORIENTATION=+
MTRSMRSLIVASVSGTLQLCFAGIEGHLALFAGLCEGFSGTTCIEALNAVSPTPGEAKVASPTCDGAGTEQILGEEHVGLFAGIETATGCRAGSGDDSSITAGSDASATNVLVTVRIPFDQAELVG